MISLPDHCHFSSFMIDLTLLLWHPYPPHPSVGHAARKGDRCAAARDERARQQVWHLLLCLSEARTHAQGGGRRAPADAQWATRVCAGTVCVCDCEAKRVDTNLHNRQGNDGNNQCVSDENSSPVRVFNI